MVTLLLNIAYAYFTLAFLVVQYHRVYKVHRSPVIIITKLFNKLIYNISEIFHFSVLDLLMSAARFDKQEEESFLESGVSLASPGGVSVSPVRIREETVDCRGVRSSSKSVVSPRGRNSREDGDER